MDETPLIEMTKISKRFGAIVALDNVDIDFRRGEVHSIVGENGAGKSTLVKILTGYHTTYDGCVTVRGQIVRFQGPRDSLNAGIGCVYQERNLVPALSVAENIFLGRMPSSFPGLVDWKQVRREAVKQLEMLGLNFDYEQKVEYYPLGMRQMTEIARIIFSGAEVIILDEPTSALSIAERNRLFEFVQRLKKQDKCIIYISHFLEEVLDVSDRITILKDGRKVNTYACSDLDKDTIIRLMSRRFVKTVEGVRQRAVIGASDKPVLECRAVTVTGNVVDASFKVHAGEALGLYGNVGSGTTGLAEALFGLRAIEGGEVWLEDKPLKKISPHLASRLGIRFIPEERRSAIWLGQKLSRNISLANLQTLSRFLIHEKTETSAAQKVIGVMDILPPDPHMLVEWFSGGNQQKAIVGRCLLDPPKVLIVCEPANGMDVGAKAGIIQKLWAIKEQGVAILIISSDPEVIVETCDRSLVFRRGALCAELHGDQISKEELVRYA
ncbi:MAG: sugar ABC transporter ATP-binding protein [Anaerolineae bacterium]|nr:sugar ABC transporter ATP-binding protein [Anaerolineae bacterium]